MINPQIPKAPCVCCRELTNEIQCRLGIMHKHCFNSNAPVTMSFEEQIKWLKDWHIFYAKHLR